MSFKALTEQAAALGSEERRKLIAILLSIQAAEDDPGRADRLAKKLDSPERWVSIEDAEKQLGLGHGR